MKKTADKGAKLVGKKLDDVGDWAEEAWDGAARKYPAVRKMDSVLERAGDALNDISDDVGDRFRRFGNTKPVQEFGELSKRVATKVKPFMKTGANEAAEAYLEDSIGKVVGNVHAISQGHDVNLMQGLVESGETLTPRLLANMAFSTGINHLNTRIKQAPETLGIAKTNETSLAVTPFEKILPQHKVKSKVIMDAIRDNPATMGDINEILKYPGGDKILNQFFESLG